MSKLIGITERILLLAIAAPYLLAIAHALPTHPTFILIATTEILAAALIMFQRSGEVAVRAYAIAIAYAGTCMSLLVRPGGEQLLPGVVTDVLMAAGLSISIWSKLALNRSFGLVAANRGIKREGPYRFVRHPMYLGYILAQIGFLAANVSARNALVYAVAWSIQLLRIGAEEKLLMTDCKYADYAEVVRWRLIPKLY